MNAILRGCSPGTQGRIQGWPAPWAELGEDGGSKLAFAIDAARRAGFIG
jgi:hypothetical protein